MVGVLALALVAWRGTRDRSGSNKRSGAVESAPRTPSAANPPRRPGLSWLAQRGLPARRIAGRVVFGGKPVDGAIVAVASAADGDARPATVTTGADGRFDVGVYEAAAVTIAATAQGKVGLVLAVDLRTDAASAARRARA